MVFTAGFTSFSHGRYIAVCYQVYLEQESALLLNKRGDNVTDMESARYMRPADLVSARIPGNAHMRIAPTKRTLGSAS